MTEISACAAGAIDRFQPPGAAECVLGNMEVSVTRLQLPWKHWPPLPFRNVRIKNFVRCATPAVYSAIDHSGVMRECHDTLVQRRDANGNFTGRYCRMRSDKQMEESIIASARIVPVPPINVEGVGSCIECALRRSFYRLNAFHAIFPCHWAL